MQIILYYPHTVCSLAYRVILPSCCVLSCIQSYLTFKLCTHLHTVLSYPHAVHSFAYKVILPLYCALIEESYLTFILYILVSTYHQSTRLAILEQIVYLQLPSFALEGCCKSHRFGNTVRHYTH